MIRMLVNRFGNLLYFILTVLTFSVILSGCASASEEVSRLRVINSGPYPVENLVVWFPEDQIVFGDVPVGATTEYIDVPNGVYRYAAYKFEVDGEIITQPVIDFMGEEPMNGALFTYTIDFDPGRVATNDWVRLVDVKMDE